MEDLHFPDARAALWSLVDGQTFAGHQVAARYELAADAYGHPLVEVPQVVIFPAGPGEVGWVDRWDEYVVEVYGPRGETSQRIAEAVRAHLCGFNVETAEGLLDTVTPRANPVALPYQAPDVSLSTMTLRVVTRPLTDS